MHAERAWRATEHLHGETALKRGCLFFTKFCGKGGDKMIERSIWKKMKWKNTDSGNQRFVLVPRFAFTAFLTVTFLTLSGMPVFASDIFGTAKNAMQTVYTDVAGIATVAAVVCAAVCLFLMNFSKSGRTVDESRAWLKRIVICWAALMTLGAIVTYLEKIIPQSMFTG